MYRLAKVHTWARVWPLVFLSASPPFCADKRQVNDLGLLLKTTGNLPAAEQLYTEGLAGRRERFGNAHPKTLTSMNNLGALYYAQGRLVEARPLADEALAGRRALLGDAHPETLQTVRGQPNNKQQKSCIRERGAQRYQWCTIGRPRCHGGRKKRGAARDSGRGGLTTALSGQACRVCVLLLHPPFARLLALSFFVLFDFTRHFF